MVWQPCGRARALCSRSFTSLSSARKTVFVLPTLVFCTRLLLSRIVPVVGMSSLASEQPLSLSETFQRAQRLFQSLEENNDQDAANECVGLFENCLRLIRRNGIFSQNETEDDLTTTSLSYLLVHAYLGKLFGGIVRVDMEAEGPAGRYKQVRRSSLHFTTFLAQLDRLEMLKDEDKKFFDLDADSRKETVEAKRARKVSDFQTEKQLKASLANLIKLEAAAKKQGKDIDESVKRELCLVLLQTFVKEALNGIDLGKRELDMLDQMRTVMGDRFHGATAMERQNPELAAARREMKEKQRVAAALEEYANRPGLTVTHIGPDGSTQEERIRAGVFRPGWNQPTMSLEEFADLEVADAIARGKRSEEAEKTKVRTLKQLEEEGLEDDEDLFEAARQKDSDWANWKDDNPKGSGVTKWC